MRWSRRPRPRGPATRYCYVNFNHWARGKQLPSITNVNNLETVDDEDLLTFLRELPDQSNCHHPSPHRYCLSYPPPGHGAGGGRRFSPSKQHGKTSPSPTRRG